MRRFYAFLMLWITCLAAENTNIFFDPSLLELSLEDRIIQTANLLVGKEVSIDPLGEGFGFDPDPLISTKKFDCTTFVEFVLATSLSDNESELTPNLNKIRYKNAKISFYTRNHFMVSDWTPENISLGLISPIPFQETLPKQAFKKGRRRLNKTIWFFHRVIDLMEKQGKSSKEIIVALQHVPEANNRKEEATYLLTSYFTENLTTIRKILPKVSVVMFIRNMPSLPTLVTHMGLLVQEDTTLYLYHAPQRRPWKVAKETLDDYFLEMSKHRAPIEGLLIYKINKI